MAFVKENWWHVDPEGRRIGWMWPEDMEAILEAKYGARKWVNGFSREFGISRTTMDRYRKGSDPITKSIAALIEMIGVIDGKNIKTKPLIAPWLPNAQGAQGAASHPTLG